MRKYKIPHKFEFTSIITLYAQWIREGKLKVNSDWNKDLNIKFTIQDPCNIVRKTERQEMADDLRFVVKTIVGEENFVDMVPCGVNNYCCGGGSGFAIMGGHNFNDWRHQISGRKKFEQILNAFNSRSYSTSVLNQIHNKWLTGAAILTRLPVSKGDPWHCSRW